MPSLPVGDNLVLMFTIIDRALTDKMAKVFSERGSYFNLVTHAIGGASSEILAYSGLGDTKRSVILSIMSYEKTREVLEILILRYHLDKPGNGIAFTMPINYVSKIMKLEVAEQEFEETMDKDFTFNLILAISERGYSDYVIDAAKQVTNVGATIIHARGIGLKEAEKFFGITISLEKDVILIVTPKDSSKEIIQSILLKAGPKTEAKAVAISLPLIDVAGLSLFSN